MRNEMIAGKKMERQPLMMRKDVGARPGFPTEISR